MKISIGINIFNSYKRQDQCIYVLNKIKNKHPNIELYNITFKHEKNNEKNFIHLPLLERNASDILKNSISKKPISKDFFDILSKTDCDYFIFLNSDILLTEKLLKKITNEYETYCFSRTDALSTKDLSNIVPWKIEIAGFDAWAVKKEWWCKNSYLFNDYIYAENLWDVSFSLTMFNNSKSILCNKEHYLLHEKHELNWKLDSIEAEYNKNLWEKTKFHKEWYNFIYKNLIKRKPEGQFFEPLYNEEELEKTLLIDICDSDGN